MTYNAQSTARAEADVDHIYQWIFERSEEGAVRWYNAYCEAAERLRSSPLACGIAPESKNFAEQVRHILFKTRQGSTYRALFVVRGDTVHILCVRGPGERPVRPEDIAS
jgi:plasmid stabilization system protein ParE